MQPITVPMSAKQHAEQNAECVPAEKADHVARQRNGGRDARHAQEKDLSADPLAPHVGVDPRRVQHIAEDAAVDHPSDRDERREQREPGDEHPRLHVRVSSVVSGRCMRRRSHITPNRSTMPDPQPVEHAIVGAPARARAVVHVDRQRCAAVALHERRQEAVHVIEERQIQIGAAENQLQSAAGVRGRIAEHARANAVGIRDETLFSQRS
jgi:hypothetical protein